MTLSSQRLLCGQNSAKLLYKRKDREQMWDRNFRGRDAGNRRAPGDTFLREVHLGFASASQVQAVSSFASPRQCTRISQ